jgi:hypothetical protein
MSGARVDQSFGNDESHGAREPGNVDDAVHPASGPGGVARCYSGYANDISEPVVHRRRAVDSSYVRVWFEGEKIYRFVIVARLA